MSIKQVKSGAGVRNLNLVLASSVAMVGALALSTPAATSEAVSSEYAEIDEILVTARKQVERVQDVPMAITSVPTSNLTSVGATRVLDIMMAVPGLSAFSQTGAPGSVSLNIRGISTADASSITVATTLDDVPVNSSSANAYAGYAGLDLLPSLVGSIEILKGPQGTLYGASSLGGLMKYVTPTPSQTETAIEIGGGVSFMAHSDQVGTRVYVKGETPVVSDKFSLGFAVEQVDTPGYIDNAVTGENDENDGIQRAGRLTAYFTPGDTFSLKLNAIAQHTDFDGMSAIQIDPDTQEPIDGYYNSDFPLARGSLQDTQIYTANAELDLGGMTLTSVTGYSHLKSTYLADLSRKGYSIFFGVNAQDEYSFRTNKFTQELRLSSDFSDAISWNIGGFYTKENSFYIEEAVAFDKVSGGVSPTLNPFYFSTIDSDYEEIAGFASLNWQVTDTFDINVSGRYSENTQHAQADSYGILAGAAFFSPEFSSKDHKFTYAVTARYFVEPDVMVYGRVATGYRPGGPNLLLNVPPTFKPDTTTNYELGLKSSFFDRRLVFDLTGFYIDWSDIHVFERQGALATYTGNGGSAESKGVELSTHYNVTPELRLGVTGGYTDAELSTEYVRLLAPAGYSLPNQAKWTGAFKGDWGHELDDGSMLTAGFTWTYIGSRLSDFPGANPSGIRLDGYDTLNLRFGYETGGWNFGAYVRNLTDNKAYVTRRNAGAVILQPRMIGLNVSRKF